ncbi:hypothetical protein PATSB16_10330 [Pandoraea thiooxydans]|nr:hypothetical protein PATSB16_10330 [Pandoraea thiooxydans]
MQIWHGVWQGPAPGRQKSILPSSDSASPARAAPSCPAPPPKAIFLRYNICFRPQGARPTLVSSLTADLS